MGAHRDTSKTRPTLYPVPMLDALRDCLAKIYWYKDELRRFLRRCGVPESVINRPNWGDQNVYKIRIADEVVTALDEMHEEGLRFMRALIKQVLQFKNFDHLRKLEDGEKKAAEARSAVARLHNLVEEHDPSLVQHRGADRRRPARDSAQGARAFSAALGRLQRRFASLVTMRNRQERGRQLESFLYDLFGLFDLNPKWRFRIVGEQIDGAFELDGTQYILEARWRDKPADKADLDVFEGKVRAKLENTLGLFLSINGFSEEALRAKAGTQAAIILMTGEDMMAVLEERISLPELLRRKKRFAAQTGDILYLARDMLREEPG